MAYSALNFLFKDLFEALNLLLIILLHLQYVAEISYLPGNGIRLLSRTQSSG